MLLFSTILSIDGSMKKEDFVKLVIEWNQGSPYESNVIKGIEWNGEYNIRFGHQNLWLEIQEYRNKNIIAVRYEKTEENGTKWDTDYVMNFNTMKMAIRLDRSFTEEALKINAKFSTPHFITLLIENNYLRKDKKIDITNNPIYIEDSNIKILTDIINRVSSYKLPIVYISRTFSNELPLNVGLLASKLKGVAHVLVQDNVSTNGMIREQCDGRNEYGGAVGIYFPNNSIEHCRYLYRTYTNSSNVLMNKVVSLIVQYSNAQRIDSLYTWQGVNNALLTDRLLSQKKENKKSEDERKQTLYELLELKDNLSKKEQNIKKKALDDAKAEVDELLQSVDNEIEEYQEKISRLSQEIEKLECENIGLREKLSDNLKVPIIFLGEEDDLYPGEIKDLILLSLKEKLKETKPFTRRYDVIEDIIMTNNYQAISEKRTENARNLLKNYSGMTPKIKKGLEEIGYVITHEKNHYKAAYYGDDRYMVIHGATPGDSRSGKNNVSNTIKKAF